MRRITGIYCLLLASICGCAGSTQNDEATDQPPSSLGRDLSNSQNQGIPQTKAEAIAAETLEESVYYYDGKHRRELWLDPELLADFAPSESSKSTFLAAVPTAQERPGTNPSLRLWKLPTGYDVRILAEDMNAGPAPDGFSPVLRSGRSPRTQAYSIPGGVIVVFKPEWTTGEIEAWARQRVLEFASPLAMGKNAFLIESAAGLPSLELANEIFESGEVVSAQPNFWREASPR